MALKKQTNANLAKGKDISKRRKREEKSKRKGTSASREAYIKILPKPVGRITITSLMESNSFEAVSYSFLSEISRSFIMFRYARAFDIPAFFDG